MKPYRLNLLSAILLPLVALSGCTPLGLLNQLVPNDGYARTEGLAYGPAARHKLDIYAPEEIDAPAPVVVFFYGGSWKRGERGSYRFVAQALTAKGFVAVLPDYRLYPDVRFPDFVEDAAKAVAWVRQNIAPHGGDPGRIFLMGHSAGAHIASLLALDPRYLRVARVPRDAIAGVIGLAGPYAFDPLKYRSVRPVFENLRDKDQARPVSFASKDAPPMLLLHGKSDSTVRPNNSSQLAEALRTAGAEAEVVLYPNLGHAKIVAALAKPLRHLAPVLDDTAAFIEKRAKAR